MFSRPFGSLVRSLTLFQVFPTFSGFHQSFIFLRNLSAFTIFDIRFIFFIFYFVFIIVITVTAVIFFLHHSILHNTTQANYTTLWHNRKIANSLLPPLRSRSCALESAPSHPRFCSSSSSTVCVLQALIHACIDCTGNNN